MGALVLGVDRLTARSSRYEVRFAVDLADGLGENGRAQGDKLWEDGDFTGDGNVDIFGDGVLFVENLGSDLTPAADSVVLAAANSLADPIESSVPIRVGRASQGQSSVLQQRASYASTRRDTSSTRRPSRRSSAREVDLALKDLTHSTFPSGDFSLIPK